MLWVSLLILLLIGAGAAIFGSIVGLGGGIIIVPLLIMLGEPLMGEPVSTQIAVGTSLAVLIFTSLTATLTYGKQGKVDYRTGWLFFAASGPASMLGAQLTTGIKAGPFQLAFGLLMLVMFGLMMARERIQPLKAKWSIKRTFMDGEGKLQTYGYNLPIALAIGLGVGMCSGMFGIGGGSLFVPLMILFFRFPPHIASATSMFVILLSAVLGSGVHVVNGNIDWLLFAALAPGALIGGSIGARIASSLSGKQLLRVLQVTLLAMAIYLIYEGVRQI